MAFHPYPQLIPPIFNLGGFGPPHALTRASTWPWVDHPASGPRRATGRPIRTRCRYGSPPRVNLATRRRLAGSFFNRHAITPPNKVRAGALTARERPVSGTISLPSRGTFHHSLTVLSTIGHQEVFRQPSGLGRFTQDSTSPVLLGHHPRHAPTSSAYGGITHYATPSQTIQLPASTRARSPAEDQQDSPTTPHTQPLPSITRTRFNHHPLSLATTHGISSPTGTKMFHFPASPPTPYTIQMQVTRHNSCRVPPFGNPRITARQPAPRGISQATTSFIGP